MKMKFKIGLFLYALILPLSACASEPQTEVHVTVLDDDGAPVENADVALGFTPRSGDGPLVRSKTDAEGMVRKKGFSIQPIRYWITKEGCYPSSGEAPNHIRNTTSYPGGPIGWAFDESVDLKVILREIRNPVPMYASRIRMDFPESKGTFAFDLMVNPHPPAASAAEKQIPISKAGKRFRPGSSLPWLRHFLGSKPARHWYRERA